MQRESVDAPPPHPRRRATAALLAIAALAAWVIAAVLYAFVIPAVLADPWPLAAPESAAAGTRIAATSSAVIGVGVLDSDCDSPRRIHGNSGHGLPSRASRNALQPN
jgi:hypothetical protein